jgi:hypothetical protein
VFERFTETARRAVVLAQQAARDLGHRYIGTEHLLLGLLGTEGSVARDVLTEFRLSPSAIRSKIIEVEGRSNESPAGQIPFTPRTKKVLELSLREALSLGHSHIGTEHLLLGLVRENEGVAARLLADANVEVDAVREAIVRLMYSGRSDKNPARDHPGRVSVETPPDLGTSGRRAAAAQADDADGLSTEATVTDHDDVEDSTIRTEDGRPASLEIPPRAVADVAASVDAIGIRPLVDGLVALVNDVQTQLPLAIAITGEWGAGKSSVMHQLRARLASTRPVDKHGILHSLSTRRYPRGRVWWTAAFDAWKYERTDRMWAAMTKAIYEDTLHQRRFVGRAVFRARLESERQGRAVFWSKLTLPFLPLAVAVAYATMHTNLHRETLAIGTFATIIFGVAATQARWSGIGALFADPFKRALEAYCIRPRYTRQLGFTSEAQADVRALTALLTRKENSGLAVFVDDLDRCTPLSVVDAVEAINQVFNASSDNHTLFILGMDSDVVAASIESAYEGILGHLEPARQRTFGRDYLRKIVQITIALPEPNDAGMERLLDSILGSWSGIDVGDGPGPSRVREFQESLSAGDPISAEAVSHRAVDLAATGLSELDDAALAEATRIERARRLGSDSEDVAAAEAELLPYLPRNPRGVKQFDNAFRLQLHVANGTPGSKLDFSFDQLIAIGKWVVLRLRWPDLAHAIDADNALLARLEEWANANNGEYAEAERATALSPWVDDGELVQLLRDVVDARRISHLPLDSFVRIA